MGFLKAALPGAQGPTGPAGPAGPAGGGGSPPGVEIDGVTLGSAPAEQLVCVVGASPESVIGFWFMYIGDPGTLPLDASDDDGLVFTVNCRNAAATIVFSDYATTAIDVETLHGIGVVDQYAVGSYMFAAPLTAPAGGSITIESSTYGAGVAIDRFVMGVYLG